MAAQATAQSPCFATTEKGGFLIQGSVFKPVTMTAGRDAAPLRALSHPTSRPARKRPVNVGDPQLNPNHQRRSKGRGEERRARGTEWRMQRCSPYALWNKINLEIRRSACMPKGGPREGAGRPRGSRGKRTKDQSLKRRRSGRRRLRFCWSRCTPRAPRGSEQRP